VKGIEPSSLARKTLAIVGGPNGVDHQPGVQGHFPSNADREEVIGIGAVVDQIVSSEPAVRASLISLSTWCALKWR
jgi:hypothetical protein